MGIIANIRQGLQGAATGNTKEIVNAPAPPSAGFQVDGPQLTYTSGILALVVASAATDIFTLTNTSSTTMIRVQRIGVGATQTTAGHVALQILKRSAQNVGGTSTNPAGVAQDSQDPFATGGASAARVDAYTANPTTLGAQIGSLVRAIRLFVPAPASATPGDPEVLYGEAGGEPFKRLVLHNNEVCAINLNAATIVGGSFNIWISWSEEVDRGPVFTAG